MKRFLKSNRNLILGFLIIVILYIVVGTIEFNDITKGL